MKERISGILKEELGFDGITRKLKNTAEAKTVMKQVAVIYNTQRPHWSNHMLTPLQMHQQCELPIRKWSKKNKKKNSRADNEEKSDSENEL